MTRAAERLDLSQPTASIWLAKLRREWRDPLFVRTSAGMQPTPRADALIGPAREALALLRRLSGEEPVFDPAAANRSFRICMTDASHITLLPRILAHVRSVGPDIRLDVAPISAATAHMLESGDADLALGYIPGLEAGFHEQRLYRQDFICLVNARHPRIGSASCRRPAIRCCRNRSRARVSSVECSSSCPGFWDSPRSYRLRTSSPPCRAPSVKRSRRPVPSKCFRAPSRCRRSW